MHLLLFFVILPDRYFLRNNGENMKLSEELKWRGFINQTTYEDITILDGNPISFYFGVDPSADSMTIGNLAAAMMVRHFIDYGHNAYLLVGGATGMIGDPDGKVSERNLKTVEDIAKNKAAIVNQYNQFFQGKDFTIVDNYDWFKDLNYLDFLRNVGKYVPMGQMLGRDFVQTRLGGDGTGISYAEFSYTLIQGYDFLHLFREHGVILQLCGADQWGNSITGVDLIRRIEGKEVNVFSTPLILNRATGVKFGKSEGGAIWLDANKTSVYKFYQFWLNVDDDGAIDYLKIYTLLPRDKINDLEKQTNANPGARMAQKTLAHEVTVLVHGAERTASVERVTDVLFGNSDFSNLDKSDIRVLSNEIPTVPIGTSLIDALTQTELVSSNGEARRLIVSGAISINNDKISDDRILDSISLIKKGKNNFVLVC
jgi:tyrosyl-tRNA synthetase